MMLQKRLLGFMTTLKNMVVIPKKSYIQGCSAGTHIGTLVTANEQYLKAQGKSTDIIKGVFRFGFTL